MSSGEKASEAGGSAESRERQGTTSPTADTDSISLNIWQRWRGRTDVPFYQYCDFYPGEESEGVGSRQDEVWIYYIPQGRARQALRYTPMIIFLIVLLMGSAELATGSGRLSHYLQGVGFEDELHKFMFDVEWLFVLLWLGWLFMLLWLLNKAELLPQMYHLQSLIIYMTLLILLGDAVYWFIQVTIAIQGETIDQLGDGPFLPGSGFLLIMFIGGHLVYDGMLRTENMFSRLHEKDPPIIGPSDPDSFETEDEKSAAFERARDAYKSNFLRKFKDSLEHKLSYEFGDETGDEPANEPTKKQFDGNTHTSEVLVPTAYVFSVVFVFPFFVIRLPDVFRLSDVLLAVVLSLLSLAAALVLFQFFVLIKYFNQLLTKYSPYESNRNDGFTLQYQPDHPDGYAGFRDLGKFATRVNTLLFFGGLYTVYWLYTSGFRTFPLGGIGDPSGGFIIWSFHYLSFILVYTLTIIVWIYFSFWQIHKAMKKGRERWMEMEIDNQAGEFPEEKHNFRQAPIWPLNVRVFVSIIVGDTLPLLSLLPLVLN